MVMIMNLKFNFHLNGKVMVTKDVFFFNQINYPYML
jgi:hypothetical protein